MIQARSRITEHSSSLAKATLVGRCRRVAREREWEDGDEV